VALGDTALGKERIEVFANSVAAVLDDFRFAEFYRNGRRIKKLKRRGKGHEEEMRSFITALQEGRPSPISFKSLVLTTVATFSIKESLKKQAPVTISASPAYQVMKEAFSA
jgi:hypothetical protein